MRKAHHVNNISEAAFSQAVCPGCLNQFYPDDVKETINIHYRVLLSKGKMGRLILASYDKIMLNINAVIMLPKRGESAMRKTDVALFRSTIFTENKESPFPGEQKRAFEER